MSQINMIYPEEIADEAFVTPDDRTNSEEFIRQSQATIDEIADAMIAAREAKP